MDKCGSILEIEVEGSMEGNSWVFGLCHRWKIVFLAKIGDPGRWPVLEKELEFCLIPVELTQQVGDLKCRDQGVVGMYGLGVQRELPSQRCKRANTWPTAVTGVDEMIWAAVRREKTQGWALHNVSISHSGRGGGSAVRRVFGEVGSKLEKCALPEDKGTTAGSDLPQHSLSNKGMWQC